MLFYLLQIPSTSIANNPQLGISIYILPLVTNMSIISASCCLLLLLCVSLNGNACSGARLLGEEKKLRLSDDKKTISLDKISLTVTATVSNKIEAAATRTVTGNKMKDAGEISDNAVQQGSGGSNSWTVPRTKNGDKHPGFNLDYSPPKTHPPSHN